ncbi:serine racemase isoform X2 [Suncus etruscus]|uniref:serine racemase isoform X2 n=1 Tax=Suncus etruscus TaxID=109475 RepID=UPI00210FC4F5|nr:serine racemase isoform X2 [Suncus etruscus]
MNAQYCISFADVEKALINIQDFVHLTPVLTNSTLNQATGRNLFFKCELFQKTGSFKIRGALNAIRSLISATSKEKPKAVVTHSSGNHGQALAYAAKLEGIPAYIVVPQTAPNCKKLAIQAYGASIAYSEQSDEALRPSVKVYAAEPLNADDCYQSKLKGELTPNTYPPETIADGVKSSIGLNTWPIIRDLVDDVFTVTEDEIKHAAQLVWERMKLLIEPTAAVGIAAVLSQHFQTVSPEVKNICIVLSGGNVDLTSLTWVKEAEAERPVPY